MSLVILNAKVHKDLKEAVRVVAFKSFNSNSSATIVKALENNPDILRELKKIKKLTK